MTGVRLIAAALFFACALVATVIVALSIGAATPGADEPQGPPLRAPQVGTPTTLAARPKAAPAEPGAQPRNDPHSALPRLWLGGPPR
jgi:hypothetical protein